MSTSTYGTVPMPVCEACGQALTGRTIRHEPGCQERSAAWLATDERYNRATRRGVTH